MNWDILIGRARQYAGRLLQSSGQRMDDRRLILRGEALEYRGRLQTRYGTLKHEAQWGGPDFAMRMKPIARRSEPTLATKKFQSP